MKISKYENRVFPYSVHSTVNLLAWRSNNINAFAFSPLFTETITTESNFFFQNYMKNVVKIDQIREKLSPSHFVT